MQEQTLLAQWMGDNWIDHYMPHTLWGQVLLGLAVLAILVLLAGWITARVLTTIARRTLTAVGHDDWSVALSRRRVFRNLSYAVPLLVIMSNIGLLPIAEKYAGLMARIFLLGGIVFFFMALSGVLSAWQDIHAASNRAQTHSITGKLELGKIIVWAVCLILVISKIGRAPCRERVEQSV